MHFKRLTCEASAKAEDAIRESVWLDVTSVVVFLVVARSGECPRGMSGRGLDELLFVGQDATGRSPVLCLAGQFIENVLNPHAVFFDFISG
jgi:hypothetical protein